MSGMLLMWSVVDRAEAMSWPVWIAAGVTTAACVVLHYEVLRWLASWLMKRGHVERVYLIGLMMVLLMVHLIESGIYAVAHLLLQWGFGGRVGVLEGGHDGSLADSLYFSIAVYTTVGFGDIVPVGPIRLLVGVEALAGLVLITWSASFTFLVMQKAFEVEKKTKPGSEAHT